MGSRYFENKWVQLHNLPLSTSTHYSHTSQQPGGVEDPYNQKMGAVNRAGTNQLAPAPAPIQSKPAQPVLDWAQALAPRQWKTADTRYWWQWRLVTRCW